MSLASQHEQAIKHAADAISAAAVIGTIAGYLPAIAALLGIIWYVLQIYNWFEKRWQKKHGTKRRASDMA